MPKTMTASEAARRLGVTLDAIYRLIWANKLPGERRGNRWLIPVAAIEARLKSREERDATLSR